MEVVGSVSAILGIVGIASQALNGIVKLRGFFQDYSEASEKTGRFIRELNSLIQVIVDVKSLLGKLQDAQNRSIVGLDDMALTSLKIHLEDCSKDFEHFLRVAKDSCPKVSGSAGKAMLKKFAVAANRKGLMQIIQEIESHKSSISLKLSVISRSMEITHSMSLQTMAQAVNEKLDAVTGLEIDTQHLVVKNLQKFDNFELRSREAASQSSECMSRMEAILHKQGNMIASIRRTISNPSFAGSEARREIRNSFVFHGKSQGQHQIPPRTSSRRNSAFAMTEDGAENFAAEAEVLLDPSERPAYRESQQERQEEPSTNSVLPQFLQGPEFAKLRRTNFAILNTLPDSIADYNLALAFLTSFKAFRASNLEGVEDHERQLYENPQLPINAVSGVRYRCWIEGHDIEDFDILFARIIGCDQYELPSFLPKSHGSLSTEVPTNPVGKKADAAPLFPVEDQLSADHISDVQTQEPPNFRLWTSRHDRINTWMLQNLLQCAQEKAYHKALIKEILPLYSLTSDLEWERSALKHWHLDAAASIPVFNVPSTNGAVNSQGERHSEKVSLQGEIHRMRKQNHDAPPQTANSHSHISERSSQKMPHRPWKRQRDAENDSLQAAQPMEVDKPLEFGRKWDFSMPVY